jgi:S-adenosylmethionine:tRNA ribosyltransferase-isomerase
MMNDEQATRTDSLSELTVHPSSFNIHPFFDYLLPPHLIAQTPSHERDQARLLVIRRQDGSLDHYRFHDLPNLLAPGDLLILNDTRVLPARLLGRRKTTGGKWEGLFLRQFDDGTWEMLCQTRGRLVAGETIEVEPGPLELLLLGQLSQGRWQVKPSQIGSPAETLQRHGHVPLPPYIRKGQDLPEDRDRYQTVYAQHAGAVAAPTAGLHFTPALLERLKERDIAWAFVTLHVGPGTFQPIQASDFRQHRMHSEWGSLPETTIQAIAACREKRGKIVAVGTTSVRVLETVAGTGPVRPWTGETDLFIYPPYSFRVSDALITNFHLPHSTLLLLAGAFAGVELLEKAYKTAMEERYRFYSYGDAMLIV